MTTVVALGFFGGPMALGAIGVTGVLMVSGGIRAFESIMTLGVFGSIIASAALLIFGAIGSIVALLVTVDVVDTKFFMGTVALGAGIAVTSLVALGIVGALSALVASMVVITLVALLLYWDTVGYFTRDVNSDAFSRSVLSNTESYLNILALFYPGDVDREGINACIECQMTEYREALEKEERVEFCQDWVRNVTGMISDIGKCWLKKIGPKSVVVRIRHD